PSLDHRVTQCKSTVKISVGMSRIDFKSHRRKTSVPLAIVNSHWSSGTRGVGPADRTGKSVVRYCPGGSFTSPLLRRPEKPREMMDILRSPCERSIVLWTGPIRLTDRESNIPDQHSPTNARKQRAKRVYQRC